MGVREISIIKRYLTERKKSVLFILLCALFFNVINLYTFEIVAQENIDEIVEENKLIVETLPMATELTYGQSLEKSDLTDGIVKYKDTIVEGYFTWEYPDIIPTVKDSNLTEYSVIFIPLEEVNYNRVKYNIKLTINKAINPENIPKNIMNVSSYTKKVGYIKLPENWQWRESDKNKTLKFGQSIVAKAVYNGEDRENYEVTEIEITIIRENCKHEHTELRNYIKNKYTGDLYCIDCGEKLSTGKYISTNNSVNKLENQSNEGYTNGQVSLYDKDNSVLEENDDEIDLENVNEIEEDNVDEEEENGGLSPTVTTVAMALALGIGVLIFLKGKI